MAAGSAGVTIAFDALQTEWTARLLTQPKPWESRVLVKDLASALGVPFEGDGERNVTQALPLEEAGPGDLSFVTRGKALAQAESSQAGCLLAPEDFDNATGRTILRTPDPRAAIARAIQLLYPRRAPAPGIHATAVLGDGVQLGAGVSIGPYVCAGSGVCIGDGVSIGAGCVIGDDVRIGAGSILHPRVTIYSGVSVGDEAILHSGCVLGADGFGFVFIDGAYQKFPQVGRVEIGNRVEIGAGTCIDRAALGVTSIGDGCKFDNMVHIAHNCKIGKHVVIAAQTGLSGGVVVEDYAVIGGQVGIGDKARIESRAVLGSGSGVLTSKIVRGGEVMWGTPARPLKQHLAQLAALSRLAKGKKPKGS